MTRLTPTDLDAIRKRVTAFGTQPDPGCTQRNADIIALLSDRDATMEGTVEALIAVIGKVPVAFRDDPNGGLCDELPIYLKEHHVENIARAVAESFTLAGAWRPIAEYKKTMGTVAIYWPAITGRNAKCDMMRIDTPGMTPFREPSHFFEVPAPPSPKETT